MTAKAVLFVVAGLALSCALWVAFSPPRTTASAATSTAAGRFASGGVAAASAASTSATSSPELTFELVLKNGHLVSGPERLEVQEGDIVDLEIVSDTRDELHLHGYDLRAQIMPGRSTRLSFRATRTGRFGLELHGAHSELAALEVYPR